MWYNARPMLRRVLALAILAMLVIPLAGGIIAASVCLEPCSDDEDGASCTPACAACTACKHSQTGIVGTGTTSALTTALERAASGPKRFTPSQPPADIFHVPLFG